jgi:hypothetical protein
MGCQSPNKTIRSFRPPGKPTSRKPLLSEPKSLTIVAQDFYRCAASIAEHKHTAAEWIGTQYFPAYPSQPIDAFAEIHRLHRQQNPHLRCYLDHVFAESSPFSASSTVPNPVPFTSMWIRAPRIVVPACASIFFSLRRQHAPSDPCDQAAVPEKSDKSNGGDREPRRPSTTPQESSAPSSVAVAITQIALVPLQDSVAHSVPSAVLPIKSDNRWYLPTAN